MKRAYLADGYVPAGPGRIRCNQCGALVSSNAFARKAHSRSCIDWQLVKSLQLRSFQGERLSPEDQQYVQRAFTADPKRYGQLQQLVKSREIRRIQMQGHEDD